jgi:hypothetical protein
MPVAWSTVAIVVLFMVQTSVAPMLSRQAQAEAHFSTPAAVLAGEALKVPLCLALFWSGEGRPGPRGLAATIVARLRATPYLRHALLLSVLYTGQNMLGYMGAQRLQPYMLSTLQQAKLLTTVLFCFLLLKRRLAWRKVAILCVMSTCRRAPRPSPSAWPIVCGSACLGWGGGWTLVVAGVEAHVALASGAT